PHPTLSASFADALSGVDAASARVLLDGDDRTAAAVVTATGVTLDAGTLATDAHTFTVSIADVAGNRSEARSTFTVPPPVGGELPPDPVTVAPPVSPTVGTTLAASSEFLYTGPSPIQTGVQPGAIEPRRASVLRGRVLDREGGPLAGVEVRVLAH